MIRECQLINIPMIDAPLVRELCEILRNVCTEEMCLAARISRTN